MLEDERLNVNPPTDQKLFKTPELKNHGAANATDEPVATVVKEPQPSWRENAAMYIQVQGVDAADHEGVGQLHGDEYAPTAVERSAGVEDRA